MSGFSVDEHQLLCFFEAEPRRADPDVPWPYNSFTYRASVGAYEVSFGIAPAHGDLSLAVRHAGAELYQLTALSVDDVRYHRDGTRETLEIVISPGQRLFLRLRPTPLITQDAANRS